MVADKDVRYFPFHYAFLKFIGLGLFHDPKYKNFDNFSNPLYVLYSTVQIGFWVFLFTVALLMEVPRILDDLDRLMLNLSFSITFVLSFIKLYIVIARNKQIQEIVYAIEEEMCDFSQSRIILEKTVKISKRLTLSVLAFANLTVVGLVIGGAVQAVWSPKIHQAKHKDRIFLPSDRILPMPVYFPFEISSDLVYGIAFVYQILGIQWYGNLVVLINTFMNTIMVHLSGRFNNLSYVLENVKKIVILNFKNNNYKANRYGLILTKDFNVDDIVRKCKDDDYEIIEAEVLSNVTKEDYEMNMYLCLRECIIHHISIISCVEKFEAIYNIGFLVHVINNLNIICHVMIQIAENDLLSIRCGTAIALFFTVVSEFLVQCYAGNELSLQAKKIAESAYNCSWYSSTKRFKQLIMVMMMRAQKPLNITAGKFIAIDNTSFVAIMRGAYSFFAVIRSTKGE